MASTTADLWFRFFSDTRGLEKGTRNATRELSKTEKAGAGVQRGWSNMTKAAGALGLAVGGMEMARWAYDATQMAEKANIVAESFNTTFGPAAADLRDELEQTRRIMGLNSAEFETALLPLGQLSQAMGLSRDEAAMFSQELFVVAGDLAAFDGDLGDAEQALGAVQSALKGEFDPLEAFGVKLKAADIEARALKDTGKELTSELTDQERATALLALVLEQATDETGALIAMQDTAQGSTNQLTSEFEDLKIQLGQQLLPTVVSTTKGLLDGIRAMKDAGDSSKSFSDRLYSLWRGYVRLMEITPVVGQIISAYKRIFSEAARSVSGFVDKVGELIGKIRAIPSRISNPFSGWKMPSLPGFATGGTVDGPRGAPQLAVVHGGEEIRTPSQQATSGGGMGGGGVVINVNAALSDPQAIATQIVELLSVYNRTQGALPVTVRDGTG